MGDLGKGPFPSRAFPWDHSPNQHWVNILGTESTQTASCSLPYSRQYEATKPQNILFKFLNLGSLSHSNGSMPEVKGVCTQTCNSWVTFFMALSLLEERLPYSAFPTPIVGCANLSFIESLDSWSDSVSLLCSYGGVLRHRLERLEIQVLYLKILRTLFFFLVFWHRVSL